MHISQDKEYLWLYIIQIRNVHDCILEKEYCMHDSVFIQDKTKQEWLLQRYGICMTACIPVIVSISVATEPRPSNILSLPLPPINTSGS